MKRWQWVSVVGGLLSMLIVIPVAWHNVGDLGGIAWASDVKDNTLLIQQNIQQLQKQNQGIIDSLKDMNKAQKRKDDNLRLYLEYLINCQIRNVEPDQNLLDSFRRSLEESIILDLLPPDTT